MKQPYTPQNTKPFVIFPALDLRSGQVVRLLQGDPSRQTTYDPDPASVALRWCREGAQWLHIVNLDGAFGEHSDQNRKALDKIIDVAQDHKAGLQFGGGIRTPADAVRLFSAGINRIVIGTMAMRNLGLVSELITQFGADNIAVGLDARQGEIFTHGWTRSTGINVRSAAADLRAIGLKWLIYTDILRDGMQTGLALDLTAELKNKTGMAVIASGGVSSVDDVRRAKKLGLDGVIIGKALYENHLNTQELFGLAN